MTQDEIPEDTKLLVMVILVMAHIVGLFLFVLWKVMT
jgi:hypothetical protein